MSAPRWRAPTFVKLTVGMHAGALAALGLDPASWPWAVGAMVANHAVALGAGMFPRGTLLGANLSRIPASNGTRPVAVTFDDGPDPDVTPRVLEILDRHDARATFFFIGRRAEQHTDLVAEVARRGHRVENHSYRHVHTFAWKGPGGVRAEVERAQEVLERATGRRPELFRAPAGMRNFFLDPVLLRSGLRLVSWSRRGFDTVDANPDTVTRRLTRGLEAGEVLVLHDGSCDRPRTDPPVVLEVLPRVLDAMKREGLEPGFVPPLSPPLPAAG